MILDFKDKILDFVDDFLVFKYWMYLDFGFLRQNSGFQDAHLVLNFFD